MESPTNSFNIREDKQVKAVFIEEEFAGGSGTESDPYLVETAYHLNNVRDYKGAYFRQIADISLDEFISSGGWQPIGTTDDEFMGTYDGNGYQISSLFIERSSTDNIGLFGITATEAVIRNTSLQEIEVEGQDNVGGLVGNNKGKIIKSSAQGMVQATNQAGGLTGNNQGSITASYADSNIDGKNKIGGLVGTSSGSITDSYSKSKVNGESSVGSLVGDNSGDITASYYDEYVSTVGGAGQPLTTYELMEENNLDGWDFAEVWQVDSGNSYPYFQWQEDNIPVPEIYELKIEKTGEGNVTPEPGYHEFVLGEPVELTAESTQNGFFSYWKGVESRYEKNITITIQEDRVVEAVFSDFAGGSGTETDPYQVQTAEQLWGIRYFKDSHFIQTADIDLDKYSDGNGWNPIGKDGDEFNGTLQGNGYTISGLTIKRDDSNFVGLFGAVGSNGVLENITLQSVDVTGNEIVGNLSGRNKGLIKASSVSGKVKGYITVGGIAGRNEGEIKTSSSTSDINGEDQEEYIRNIGGVVGINTGTIEKSYYAKGTVKIGTHNAKIGGGFAGRNEGTISNSLSAGTFDGDYHTYKTGGFIGVNSGLIEKCFAAGVLQDWVLRPFVFESDGELRDCYVDSFRTSDANDDPHDTVKARLPRELRKSTTFTNWDFTEVWTIEEGESYPYLQWQDGPIIVPESYVLEVIIEGEGSTTPEAGRHKYVEGDQVNLTVEADTGWYFKKWQGDADSVKEEISIIMGRDKQLTAVFQEADFAGGSGTKEDPYLIETAEQLNIIRDLPESHFRQIADIDLSDYSDGSGWKPIGLETEPFAGSYDGAGYKIYNLTIDRPDTRNVGLFSNGDEATFKNIHLRQVDVTGEEYVGALVGDGGEILNSSAKGTVIGTSSSGSGGIGGLAGSGSATDSYAEVDVREELDGLKVGGLLGSGSITRCYAAGNVNGGSTVGGLVGYGITVSRSFAIGNVNGDFVTGGLAGQGKDISTSYATGDVNGGTYAGGLVGVLLEGGEIKDCYALGEISGAVNQSPLVDYLLSPDTNVVSGNYYNQETTGFADADYGKARTTAQMKAGSPGIRLNEDGIEDENGDLMYDGWSNEIWEFGTETDYPSLQWEE